MNTPVKLILGAVATGCIAVGIAAQVGTVPLPRGNPPGIVTRQQAPPAGAPNVEGGPSSTPQTTTVAAPASGDEGDGDDQGDGQGHGNGHGHKG